ncbi:DNA-binding transcriptional regulator, MarR family [Pustulibacterium marinum]|uniref:DNA-binding transcriptional regulator, MarR family n=1 Tax=Pustulibacterium marinum TaxID=1224947 RepID=A0A1I7HXA5_9FLAO|nr:MarR family transcriptional regulator [Pustulibacterium marinum]SFU65116.1 DNA-binding transcriptional regulator, MarR family [Pustulibacterium marinum]
MKREESIDYALRATWQAVARMYNEEAGKFGTTMATGLTLLSIDKEKGTPSTALGPKMGMEATSLSRILKTMEEKGLIERKRNPQDGRSVLICLTDFGKEKREVSKTVVLQFNEAIRNEVSEEKLRHFFEVTETINTLITERKIYSES